MIMMARERANANIRHGIIVHKMLTTSTLLGIAEKENAYLNSLLVLQNLTTTRKSGNIFRHTVCLKMLPLFRAVVKYISILLMICTKIKTAF